MPDVQFNDQRYQITRPTKSSRGLIGWLLRYGLAKDARQANIILLIFALVCIALAIFIYRNLVITTDARPQVTPAEMEAYINSQLQQ